MKGLKGAIYLAITSICSLGFVSSVSALTVEVADNSATGLNITDATKVSDEIVLANGNNISIYSRDDGVAGAKIVWNENGVSKSINVSDKAIIFGGSHETTEVISTNIRMYSGTVAQIFGGGLHKGHVKSASIGVYGGNVGFVMGGGAAYLARTNDGHNYTAATKDGAMNIVDEAYITISNANVENVYGGGESFNYTKQSEIHVYGGNINYLTGSGSNGFMDGASIVVSSGKVETLQAVNRGTLEDALINIEEEAEVTNLYMTAEDTAGANATGTVGNVDLGISGTVTNLKIGALNGTTPTLDLKYEDGVLADSVLQNLGAAGVTTTKYADYSGLYDMVDKAWDLIYDNADSYTDESLENLYNALNEAGNSMYETNQSKVDALTKKVENAIAALVNKDEPATANPDNTLFENPNTYDGINDYIGMTISGFGILGIAIKKVLCR